MANKRWLVLAAALLFSTGGAAIKASAFSGFQVAGLRSAFAAITLALLLPRARLRVVFSPIVLLVALSYGATLILFTLANKLTTSANAIFIQDTAPVHVLLLSPLLLAERVQRRDLPFIFAVAFGLLLFFVGTSPPQTTAPDPSLGNLLAAASSLSWALTLIGLRWLATRTGEGANTGGTAILVGNVLVVLVCLPMMEPVQGGGLTDWLWVVYLGVFQIGLAYVLLTRATPHVTALDLSLLLLLEPVLNPIWTFLAHGEQPGVGSIAGGAVVLTATTWHAVRRG